MLTLIGVAMPAARQLSSWAAAVARTQLPSSISKLDSLTAGRNSPGRRRPSSGCFQRISASTPISASVSASIFGW